VQYEKITEDLPSAEALPPPRQPIRHARRRKPGGSRSIRHAFEVEADEGRATPDPGPTGSGNLPNPVEIRSSNWRTYDGWGHLGERQKSQ